ncbi:MAG: 7-cyano-7-deazaguanine synthase [Sulfolobaceae archaeon]|nr:7-cyano-7-deazaguanine synthase [Sulfolobaceae archaeon]
MKSLLLFSSGINSTTALYLYKNNVDCLYINYGQRASKQEILHSKTLCNLLGLRLIVIDIPNLGERFNEGREFKLHEPIMHKNIILLSIALVYAKEKGYKEVIFPISCDTCEYEVQKPKILEELVELSKLLDVKLTMPFLHLSKDLIVKMGKRLGVPYELTYSCVLGYKEHCKSCPKCEVRIKTFRENGIL